MKKFIGKTQEEALNNAAAELNVPVENIYIESVEEIKKGLFGLVKNIEVTCYTDAMIVEFVQDYLKNIIELMGIEVTITPNYSDGLIKLKISTNHNSILIGKDGETLQALNEVCRCAANATFKKRVRVLLDINDYKQEKYSKLISIAKREAVKVSKTKVTASLSPMSADERRAIHNALVSFKHVKTVSVGEGKARHITIEYVD